MEETNIWAIVIGSSLFSSIITVVLGKFADTYLKKIDYKLHYHKLILNHRIDAYRQLENLLNKMSVRDMHNKNVTFLLLFDKKYLNEVNDMCYEAYSNMLFFDEELTECVKSLIVFKTKIATNFGIIEKNKLFKQYSDEAITNI